MHGLNPHLYGAALGGAEARGRVVDSQQRRVESRRQRRLDDPPAAVQHENNILSSGWPD